MAATSNAIEAPITISAEELEAQLEQARAWIGDGLHDQAAQLYRQLIEAGVQDPRPFNNLALMPALSGQELERRRLLRRALAIDPLHAEARMNLAVIQHNRGQSRQAIRNLQLALERKPDDPDLLANLSHVLIEIGELDQARAVLERAIALHPGHAACQFNAGNLLASAGQHAEAVRHFQGLVAQEPSANHLDALAQCLLADGQQLQALALYERQLQQAPDDRSTLLGLSRLLVDLGRPSEALGYLFYLQTLSADDQAATLLNGYALHVLGEQDAAMRCYEEVIARDPHDHKALNQLGICLWESGDVDRAIDCYRRALGAQRNTFPILCNLAAAYRGQGRIPIAHRIYRRILRDRPQFLEAYREFLFSLSIGSEAAANEHLQVAAAYWRAVGRLQARHPSAPAAQRPSVPHTPSRRRKVGIISAEIGFHCVSTFLAPILRNIDQSAFQLELIIPGRYYDSRSQELINLAHRCLHVDGMGAAAAAARVREQEYDLILETSGFTRSTGIDILSSRCAPVQCHYIGFHASTGLPTMDYFVGDNETASAELAPQFTEQLWALPRTWLACEPYHALPQAQIITDNPRPIFGCFNQLAKVREETLRFWAAALRRIPQSVLLIKDRLTANDSVRQRILGGLMQLGVHGDRVEFLPKTTRWAVHLEYYNLIDIALDTTPWSSATTGFDALGMGVPLIAIRGRCTSARMSSGLVTGLGRRDWLADTPERYADAVEACLGSLDQLRQGKRERQQQALASELFNTVDMTRQLETAMRSMLARCA